MTKVISINGNPDYVKSLKKAIYVLKTADSEINTAMINIAAHGKWKQWSDEQPLGTVFTFTEEMLRDTGDKNVDALCELRDKLYETLEKLEAEFTND